MEEADQIEWEYIHLFHELQDWNIDKLYQPTDRPQKGTRLWKSNQFSRLRWQKRTSELGITNVISNIATCQKNKWLLHD